MKPKIPIILSIILVVAMLSGVLPAKPAWAASPTVFINEIHYDNTGTDTGEAIEIAGPAGTDLTGWSLVLYNGATGAVYDTDSLSGTIPNLGGGFGVVVINYPSNGIQNGSPDGLALVDDSNQVIQFLSYEGVFSGVGGAANGMLSIDMGVSENGAGAVGNSLQLTGTGTTYEDFSWAGEQAQTFGAYNTGQVFASADIPVLVLNEVDYDQPSTDTAEFVEIANIGTGSAILSEYTLELVNGTGGGASIYQTITLPEVTLTAGEYFVICANAATVANCDLDVSPDTNLIQNGAPDAVGLRYGTTLIDAVSYEGDTGAPYTEGTGSGLVDTASGSESISRCPDGMDTNQNHKDFSLAPITPGSANVCADPAPTVTSTYPVNGDTNFPIAGNLTVTFSEPVNVSGSWFNLSCSTSGDVAATVSGGPAIFTLDPEVNLAGGESCTLTIYAANVTDQDSNDPPDFMASDFTVGFTPYDVCTTTYTPAYAIQGSGPAAAITGVVTTQGVVVGDNEGPSPALRGFYLQDLTGDSNAATSDGIFVFNGNNNNVNLGDVVRVTGTAAEFQDQTQISSVTSIVNCGSGTVAPVDVTFPVPSSTYLEQFESMLVRLSQTMYVTEHFQLGRFGQVVLSSGERLKQPTNVVLPGAPALALQAANGLNRIILDDDLNNQNPDPIVFARGGLPLSASNTLRGGDTATGIVGVMTYTWSGNAVSGNAYRLRPVNALGGWVNFEPANPRPPAAPEVGGTLKLVGMNLLNFFNTFSGCTNGVGGAATDCRGANNLAEFNRQWPKTVAAILAMNADVIGFNEIENDGYGPDSAIAFLVDQLNAATAPGTYAFIDVDLATGQVNALGTDAIKVGMIYRPGSVTPVGQTAALNSVAFVNAGDSEARNRPSLAQTFEQNANGSRFIVVINHLKSKGSACDLPDAGDGQGNCSQVRVTAATELMNWLATDPTGTGDPDVLLIGDYNSYAMEDPIAVIKNAGFTNLIESFIGADAYSYVFDGQWGYLDHALGSAAIVPQVVGVADYHINADEPSVLDYNMDFKSAGQLISLYAPDEFRVSDHDAVIAGLCLPPSAVASASHTILWPANHKYMDVNVTFTASSDTATITLLSVTSNEPDDGLGDGDTSNDIVIQDDFNFKLRAERSGTGSGRIYTLTYLVTNTCGASTTVTVNISVPFSMGF